MKIYYEHGKLKIRSMLESDAQAIIEVFQSYGWNNKIETDVGTKELEEMGIVDEVFENYAKRAEYDDKIAGYCTLLFDAQSEPWKKEGKPEISDLRVFDAYQQRGIGSVLLDVIERDVARFSDEITLAVGLHYGYGNAQRLYVKRGYVPDGSGVWYNSEVLEQYAECCNDDSLVLYMNKKLR